MDYDKLFTSTQVMVFDEDIFMGKILANVLESFGVRDIVVVSTITAAKDMLRQMDFSIIFMDWVGHDKPSIELLDYIRGGKKLANPRMPIIVITAHTTEHWVLQARDKGATEILAKPIVPYHVFDKLYNAIYNERPFIEVGDYKGPDRRRIKNEDYQGVERRSEVSLAQEDIDKVMGGR